MNIILDAINEEITVNTTELSLDIIQCIITKCITNLFNLYNQLKIQLYRKQLKPYTYNKFILRCMIWFYKKKSDT